MKILLLVIFPYIGIFVFLAGIIWRILSWSRTPVPFRIPLVAGQEASLSWIKSNKLGSPPSTGWAVLRLITEIVFFRSLLRGDAFRLKVEKLIFSKRRYLWFFSILFHLSFLVIILRHLRFFFEPTPGFVLFIQRIDGFLEFSYPTLFISSVSFIISLGYLFFRRIFDGKVRYVSLASDYAILILIISIATTGIILRHFFRTDLLEIKRLALGLLSFSPYVPEHVSLFFYLHIFLVSLLLAVIPFSKIVHMAGILFSPTRNLANTSRNVRHVNPWDYPVRKRTYEEYEREFREVMKASGIPLEGEEDG